MNATESSGIMRGFHLTNEPDGLGLSCTPAGVSLAGVPLLHKTQAGFIPRSAFEVTALLKAAYGENPTRLQTRLEVIAQALNDGDFATAMIAAVHTRTPELSPEAAMRLGKADQALSKYNYNPDEPRDWHGRWTTGGADVSVRIITPETESERAGAPHAFDSQQRVVENASSSVATTLSDTAIGDVSREPDDGDGSEAGDDSREPSLEQTFEKKYDDLGPVDFAKQVIQFGDWLGRNGRNLSPADLAYAAAEYSFLQDRLSFWLDYDYKPVLAQSNLFSAALTLYQGAVNGGIVRPGHLPQSMLVVAGVAAVFTDGPPRRPSSERDIDEGSAALAEAPSKIENVGDAANRSDVGITWNKSIDVQGKPFEAYIARQNPDVTILKPNATTFDLVNPVTGEAISAKTMNTVAVSYIKNPGRVFKELQGYINEVLDYEPQWDSDIDPVAIKSKSIYLAVPEWTSPAQWRQLLRAIIYGKDNGVSVVITRIKE